MPAKMDSSSVSPTPRAVEDMATPLMKQYLELKARHPDNLLFFRLGDFYELFGEDAKKASPLLEVALTHRQQVPMCGVPAHALDPYMAKLLKAGMRVAIAEQMEDPASAKGLVKRDIIRVVTPGTLQEEALLQAKRSNYLVALAVDDRCIGLAAVDSSTGEFTATEIGLSEVPKVWDELTRLDPSEIVISKNIPEEPFKTRLTKQGWNLAERAPMDFAVPLAKERLKTLYGISSLRGLGLEEKSAATAAAGAVVRYLDNTQCNRPYTLQPLRTYFLDHYLLLDSHTLDHLDILEKNENKSSVSLLSVMDQTLSPMGGRLLRRWLLAPLRDISTIRQRQDHVEFFLEFKDIRRALREVLQGWPDSERILCRVMARSASPRDLASLAQGLRRIPSVQTPLLSAHQLDQTAELNGVHPIAAALLKAFPDLTDLAGLLERALVDAPPATLKDGGVIRPGFDAELDEIRAWVHDGKSKLLAMEQREREQTGISSLKVGFNNIFGYYIEVTRTRLEKVPAHYIRKQTLANAERYITPELKEFENKILGAQERLVRLEAALVGKLQDEIIRHTIDLQRLAQAIAELDVFLSFSEVADQYRYVRPVVDESDSLNIREGRHPVLEKVLPSGTLVANDLELNGRDRQIIILTGPNMSGKSTYLRQAALIVILAQIGSYVPAREARIGVVDHIFTRIGASDRLADGESTFMVEMVETAHILNHATPQSLVILDEVGRGTSTYDGISIAWACLEYLYSCFRGGGKTSAHGSKVLFATHYFELTQLSQQFPGIHNAHVTAREWGDHVVFLHKVEPGPADRAYGIHVARLAGVPKAVLDRAQILLQVLEKKAASDRTSGKEQLSLFTDPTPDRTPPLLPQEERLIPSEAIPAPGEVTIGQELEAMDLDRLTPLDALLKLQELKTKWLQRRTNA